MKRTARTAEKHKPHKQPAAPEAAPRDPFAAWFAIILAVALVVRVLNAACILTPDNPQFDPSALARSVDMHDNHVQAVEILQNHGFPTGFFQHSPLYTYVIAAVYLVAPGKFFLVYWIQLLAGAFMCAMLYGAGRGIVGELPACIAGLIAAVYAPLLFNDLIFQSDSLAPAMVVGLLWLAVIYQNTQRPLALACAMGVVLGLCAGERTNLALLGPALAVWILWIPRQFSVRTRLVSIVIIGVISIALIAPFCYHNTRVLHKFTLTQGYVETTLGQSMGTESTGYFIYPQGSPNNPRWPVFSLGFLKLHLQKVRFLFSWFEFPDLYNYYIIGRFSPLIASNPVTFRIVGPLAILGLLLGLRRFKSLSLVYIFSFVVGFGVLTFYVGSRFRAPLMPMLFLFAGQAAVATHDAFKRKDTKKSAALIGAVVLLAVFVNSLDPARFHSMWYCDSMTGNAFRGRAIQAAQSGKLQEARTIAERVLWVKAAPYQLQGYALLAEINQALGEQTEAARCGRIAQQIQDLYKQQPQVDHHGNTYFPPSDRFRAYDPMTVIVAPADLIGYTASIYPPRKSGQ
ncbi:MAG: glycosyltransferase family 39 protein [Candidatus Sumerlaeia bacterium]